MGQLCFRHIARKPRSIHTDKIEIGEVFFAKLSQDWIEPCLFLKTFAGMVDLKNPSKTWPDPKFEIYEYNPVHAEIVVSDQ